MHQPTHLDISMKQLGGVHVFQTLEKLVHGVLLVDILQDVGSDH
jgi:hypothetical protein